MRFAWMLPVALAGCLAPSDPAGGDPQTGEPAADSGSAQVSTDAGTPVDAAVSPAGADAGGLVPGSLAVSWMHGALSCNQSTAPELQVHAYNATTYIIREDKCRTFEAPFVYLLLGSSQALLLDTGATNTVALRDQAVALAGGLPLLVAHTHAHGDHVASDSRFIGQPATTVVGHSVAEVQSAFNLANWPTGTSTLDLGGRVLDVLAIPGHEVSHIALYDRQTGILLTGDTLYAGLLFINDWTQYRASVARLQQFASTRPISHVLGAHIEMTSTPTINYDYGTTYQPAEHVLELAASHLAELDAALTALGPTPPDPARVSQCMTAPRPLDASCHQIVHDDFVIDPQ
jgi:glyoxylase-like metal-dependent hydrolase (beta-lactamase superfamily II)